MSIHIVSSAEQSPVLLIYLTLAKEATGTRTKNGKSFVKKNLELNSLPTTAESGKKFYWHTFFFIQFKNMKMHMMKKSQLLVVSFSI